MNMTWYFWHGDVTLRVIEDVLVGSAVCWCRGRMLVGCELWRSRHSRHSSLSSLSSLTPPVSLSHFARRWLWGRPSGVFSPVSTVTSCTETLLTSRYGHSLCSVNQKIVSQCSSAACPGSSFSFPPSCWAWHCASRMGRPTSDFPVNKQGSSVTPLGNTLIRAEINK